MRIDGFEFAELIVKLGGLPLLLPFKASSR